MQDDLSQALGSLQLEEDASTPTTGKCKMMLPTDVVSIILGYCDQATCLAVMRTCRDYHSVAVPYVYREITLSTPRQLRALISTSQQAAYDDRLARSFSKTRSFFYRIKQGFAASSSSKPNQPKLYTSLRDVASHTSDGKALFPNLDNASFEQVPENLNDSTAWPDKPTFLSNVTTVHLEHSPHALYDSPPDFTILGMRDVREVRMYHLAGCEISHQSLLRSHMDHQGSLEKVYFHLIDHFENTVCSDQHTSRVHTLVNGTLQPTGTTRIRRSIDTTIYINEYASAVCKLVASVAYAQISAASRPHPVYPSLKQVIIDVGSDRQLPPVPSNTPLQLSGDGDDMEECTDRQLMIKRCQLEMLKHRDRAEQRLLQATHLVGNATGSSINLPEICLLRVQGELGQAWRIHGSQSSA